MRLPDRMSVDGGDVIVPRVSKTQSVQTPVNTSATTDGFDGETGINLSGVDLVALQKEVEAAVYVAPTVTPTATTTSSSTTTVTSSGPVVSELVVTLQSSPVSPIPPVPATLATTAAIKSVKTAPIDTVLFDDDLVPIEVMTDLIFEDMGGHELISVARNDTVNGQKISYQPIKNLSSIQQQYNPNNIIGLQLTSNKYFENFSIKLDSTVVMTSAGETLGGTGPGGEYIYIDLATGDLILEVVNIAADEQVEIDIALSGTIYEADLGDFTS